MHGPSGERIVEGKKKAYYFIEDRRLPRRDYERAGESWIPFTSREGRKKGETGDKIVSFFVLRGLDFCSNPSAEIKNTKNK